jgi:hypothetical protein
MMTAFGDEQSVGKERIAAPQNTDRSRYPNAIVWE